jgi:hypothetical protein
MGRAGYRAGYMKEVDRDENTVRFYQEIYNDKNELVEIHEKFPFDKGHTTLKGLTMKITKKILGEKITSYLQHKINLNEIVHWAEEIMMEGEFDEKNFTVLRDITSQLGVADVRAFGLTWEDCEKYLNQLDYKVRVEVVAQ